MASTIKQIAQKANVSIATVSRALSDSPKVQEATRKKILKLAKELNYNPNIIARNFAKRKSNMLGLILPDISDEFFAEIIHSIDETAYEFGYFTLVVSSHKNRSMVESINTMMHSGLVGGFILLTPFMSNDIAHALSTNTVPYVLISGDSEIGDYDVITVDNYKSSFKLVEHLVAKGYKKIGHIAGPEENNDAFLRKKGFADACKKFKLEVKDYWLVKGTFTMASGEQATLKMLKHNDMPRVIFAANDMMAIGCCNALKSKGIKIPEEVAVVGFDDIILSEYSNPSLTTIKVDTDRIGNLAAQRLIEKVQKDVNGKVKKVVVPTELVTRNSC
ncbi:MAG: LacI family transcriptional regulator [Stygiobacter sp.]|nr:MAG: LacI family transcriptional regulator [Stygiobacter sp.]